MMNVTELLVMGYDDDRPVFACHLTCDQAATIPTRVDAGGDSAVEAVSSQASTAYSTVVKVIEVRVGRSFRTSTEDRHRLPA